MTYASVSIDRRAIYYARAADVIAADPLDFYTRAEKGRHFQTQLLHAHSRRTKSIVHRWLSEASAAFTSASAVRG